MSRFFLVLRDPAGSEAMVERLPAGPPTMHADGLSGACYHGLRADVLRAVGRWEATIEAYNRITALFIQTPGQGKHHFVELRTNHDVS